MEGRAMTDIEASVSAYPDSWIETQLMALRGGHPSEGAVRNRTAWRRRLQAAATTTGPEAAQLQPQPQLQIHSQLQQSSMQQPDSDASPITRQRIETIVQKLRKQKLEREQKLADDEAASSRSQLSDEPGPRPLVYKPVRKRNHTPVDDILMVDAPQTDVTKQAANGDAAPIREGKKPASSCDAKPLHVSPRPFLGSSTPSRNDFAATEPRPGPSMIIADDVIEPDLECKDLEVDEGFVTDSGDMSLYTSLIKSHIREAMRRRNSAYYHSKHPPEDVMSSGRCLKLVKNPPRRRRRDHRDPTRLKGTKSVQGTSRIHQVSASSTAPIRPARPPRQPSNNQVPV